MKGGQYSDLIAAYLAKNYGPSGLLVYREVSLGKSIIGKNRRIDVFAVHEPTQRALAIECKYQGSQGTVDEKIPYTLQDMDALRVAGVVVYSGDGFSDGVVHMLQASPMAVYCLPDESMAPTSSTRELDHIVAMTFQWWDVVLKARKPFEVEQ